ncbi:hypothetical protein [Xanthomonas campestris]|uniref:hypothetical protein n=1 Tax=Xanthomonas campestris TaxID=339 RepID=UPI002B22E771|nr:hypothetical protein [Xanthomonas campestris]MEA9705381.1 hypothetical protein [Xanthomonas campestris pv. raphani]MEA9725533.1 hypothetical protein [Xanthomonas campestris pv. raphani]MEA9772126.1 hypothetical protein [Xanthomonas campestris pv. raphani]MEA9800449.1 hypothetical protein [Xanthomonas campestris pv. raphani]MEA9830675.1 hypothetical protein [Xanthomonas campestris pv. raphani]
MSFARRVPLLVCLTLALHATPALAQRAVQGDLQSQMSAEQFKAAGLDKLDARELAALNDWLQGKVAKEAAVVVEQAKEAGRQEVIVKNRGFSDFGIKDPIESTVVGEFRGFSKGRTYTLANGQEWEQTDSTTLPGVRKDSPKTKIKPGLIGVWYMQIEGYNTQAKVRRVK